MGVRMKSSGMFAILARPQVARFMPLWKMTTFHFHACVISFAKDAGKNLNHMRKFTTILAITVSTLSNAQINIVGVTRNEIMVTVEKTDSVTFNIQNNNAFTLSKIIKVPWEDTITIPRIWCECRLSIYGMSQPVVVSDSTDIIVYDMPYEYRSVGVRISGEDRKFIFRVSDPYNVDKLIYVGYQQSYGKYKPKFGLGDYKVFVPYGHKGFHTIEVISTEPGCKVHSITYKHIW